MTVPGLDIAQEFPPALTGCKSTEIGREQGFGGIEHWSGIGQTISTICCGWLNRGLAMGAGMLFLGQLDFTWEGLAGPPLEESGLYEEDLKMLPERVVERENTGAFCQQEESVAR